jgi:tetratricopeptide (TPR) repeat protein
MREGLSEDGIAGSVGKLAYAYVMRQEKRWAEGLYFLRQLEDRFPKNILVKLLEGEFFIYLKRYPDAIARFEKVIEIDNSISRAYYLLGGTQLLEGKDLDEAEKNLIYFINTEPEGTLKGGAEYLLSVLYERRGEKDKAKSYFEDAKILVPDVIEQLESSRNKSR